MLYFILNNVIFPFSLGWTCTGVIFNGHVRPIDQVMAVICFVMFFVTMFMRKS